MKSTLHSENAGANTLAVILIAMLALGPTWPQYSFAQSNDARPADNVGGDDESDEGGGSDSSGTIAPGFLLHLACPDDPKLNGDFRVAMGGSVSLPYDKSLNASGSTVKGFQEKLEKAYAAFFKGKPRLTVTIKQRKYWVKVLGVVKSPGPYLVRDRASLDEVLALAQVRTEDLPNGYVRINKGRGTRWVSMEDYLKGGKSAEMPAWSGNETVLFQLDKPEGDLAAKGGDDEPTTPSSRKIQVLGEVRSPGSVSYQRNADGYYYLIQRGGPTQTSDLEEVSLLRRDRKTAEHVELMRGDIGNIRDIQEADVIMVHPARQTKLERLLQNTGVLAAIVSAVAVTIIAVQR